MARGRASLEQVRRRGRWKALSSVQRYSKTFALTQFRARMPQKVLEVGARATGDLAAEILRAISSRTNYSKAQKQLVDGIKQNLKAKKAKDVAAELLMLGPPKPKQKPTNKQKATKGEASSPDSDDLYSDETCGETTRWWTE